jgi:2-polyprenyl-3-methyl-5-hydroxy-6-metoxy-1,4-benzoquinol methylase
MKISISKLVKLLVEKSQLRDVQKAYLRNNQRVQEILRYNGGEQPVPGFGAKQVNALPGYREFIKNGWAHVMLLRYALAMSYCEHRRVLDSCSGLGWGAYLIDSVCNDLTCIDIDAESVETAMRIWPYERTTVIVGSVLEMPFAGNTFDVVTAMESIEHFSMHEMEKYLNEITRVLRPGGWIVGSSYFPKSRKEAEEIVKKNPHHSHICTEDEMKAHLAGRGYGRIRIYSNRLFFTAQRQRN